MKRNDAFALEGQPTCLEYIIRELTSFSVYETSMLLSIIFASPAQTTSVITHLIPNMYKAHKDLQKRSTLSIVASLLHFLVAAYPSQSRYFEHLSTIPRTFLSPETQRWLKDLTRALRQRSYAILGQMTSRSSALAALHIDKEAETGKSTMDNPSYLALEAIFTLLDTLRAKARDTTWAIVRAAYREFYCPVTNDPTPPPVRDWLVRSLALQPVASRKEDVDDAKLLDIWIQERVTCGELRQKEGVEGRWIICKMKS